ncbi:CsgG/HfaB family protein [Porticoccaceae bacterium]|nr:CsgG/HfaB family protein [Porticoccaceae bacterium]
MERINRLGRSCIVASALVLLLASRVVAADLPIIGITEITSGVDSKNYYQYKDSKSGNFQTMLETQMVKVGRFKIMERNRLDEILGEQVLQGEFSDAGTVVKVGAVDYLVYGSITKFGSKKKEISTGKFATVKVVAEFGIDLRVVDATNGEIVKAETIDVSMQTGSGMATKGISTGDSAADPLADVQRKAAKQVAAAIAESIFPIEVITFREDGSDKCCAYINYGEALLTQGDRLKIVQPGESLIDEATGLDLGSTEKTIGIVEVTESLEKFSKAMVVSGDIPEKGQIARIVKDKTGTKNVPSQQRKKKGRKI